MPKESDRSTLAWILFIHLGALAAFFTFSWKAVLICGILWWLTGGLGICLGYHRFFTHRSFETPKFIQYALAVLGCAAGEGGPLAWVAAHRYHHIHSDTEKDPHSPLKGFWWSHFTWLFRRERFLEEFHSYKKYVPDMAEDRVLLFLDRFHFLPIGLLAGLLAYFGGLSYLVWGMFVRSVIVYHSTWLVNSASHVWGYRTYKTTDLSKNNWWVALLSFGEGWHNNHHAFQRSARHGMRWWEVDVTFMTIRLLWILGLAGKIHVPVRAGAVGLTTPNGR